MRLHASPAAQRLHLDLDVPEDVEQFLQTETGGANTRAVIHALGGSTADAAYDPRLDVNADGLIDVDDLRTVLRRNGTELPAGEPSSSAGTTPSIATDVVFDRLLNDTDVIMEVRNSAGTLIGTGTPAGPTDPVRFVTGALGHQDAQGDATIAAGPTGSRG